MRIPSRRMPKAVEPKASSFRWLFITVFLGGLTWSVLSYPPVAGVLLGFTVFSGVVGGIHARQIHRVAAMRAGEGICEFAREFNTRMTDTWVIRAVYEEVQDCLGSEFPLHASDRLAEDLRIDPDDLDMVIALRVAQRTGRSLKQPEQNPHYERIITVGDLVSFFNNQPHGLVQS